MLEVGSRVLVKILLLYILKMSNQQVLEDSSDSEDSKSNQEKFKEQGKDKNN